MSWNHVLTRDGIVLHTHTHAACCCGCLMVVLELELLYSKCKCQLQTMSKMSFLRVTDSGRRAQSNLYAKMFTEPEYPVRLKWIFRINNILFCFLLLAHIKFLLFKWLCILHKYLILCFTINSQLSLISVVLGMFSLYIPSASSLVTHWLWICTPTGLAAAESLFSLLACPISWCSFTFSSTPTSLSLSARRVYYINFCLCVCVCGRVCCAPVLCLWEIWYKWVFTLCVRTLTHTHAHRCRICICLCICVPASA